MNFRIKKFFILFFLGLTLSLYSEQGYLGKSATSVGASAWTSDGKYFSTGWNNSVVLWDSKSKSIAAIYSNHVKDQSNPFSEIMSLQFTSDGKHLMSVRDDNTILIHDIETTSDSTLITGTGTFMSDAVFLTDYKIVVPLDGKNLYEFFKLRETGNLIIEKKFDLDENLWGLSASSDGKKLLVAKKSGILSLIDTVTWNEISSFEFYADSKIKPVFAPDGINFLAACDKDTVAVCSIIDDTNSFEIYDETGFTSVATFSNDSKKIAIALDSSLVKIYDIRSQTQIYSFWLKPGDIAKTLSFSPDDSKIVIGTQNGYIYCNDLGPKMHQDFGTVEKKVEKSLEKTEILPIKAPEEEPDSKSEELTSESEEPSLKESPKESEPENQTEENVQQEKAEQAAQTEQTVQPEVPASTEAPLVSNSLADVRRDEEEYERKKSSGEKTNLKNSFVLSGFYERFDGDDKASGIGVDLADRYYWFSPIFFGYNCSAGVGLPGNDFSTIEEYSDPKTFFSSPNLYNFSAGAVAGLVHQIGYTGLYAFIEAGIGVNARIFFDTTNKYDIKSELKTGSYVEALAGLQFMFFRLAAGVQYDSNYELVKKVKLGLVMPK